MNERTEAQKGKLNIKVGIVLTYISLAVSLVGSFFVTRLLLNVLGDSNYGLLSFCNSITSWFTVITSSLGGSFLFFVNKELKEKGTEKETNSIMFKILGLLALLSFILLGAILGVLKLTKFELPNYSHEENNLIFLLLLLSGASVCITISMSVFSLYLNYKKAFIFKRSFQIVMLLATYGLNLGFVLLTGSVIAIAVVSCCVAVFSGVVTAIYAIKVKKMAIGHISLKDNKALIRQISGYSFYLLLAAITSNLHTNIDKTILGTMVDAASVTTYQLSITFLVHINTLAYTFTETLAPAIHEHYQKGDDGGARTLCQRISSIQLMVVFFIVGGYVSCGRYFTLLWLGESRLTVYPLTCALMAIYAFPWCNSSHLESLKAINKHKFSTIVSVSAALANVLVSVILVFFLPKEYAVWGCVIGTGLTKIISEYILLPVYFRKTLGANLAAMFLNAGKFVLYTGVGLGFSFLILFLLQPTPLPTLAQFFISGSSFVLVYSALQVLFERNTLLSLRRKRSRP